MPRAKSFPVLPHVQTCRAGEALCLPVPRHDFSAQCSSSGWRPQQITLHSKRRNKRSVAAEHCFNCKNSPLPAEAWYNELISQVAYLELDQELNFAAFPESEVKPQVRPVHNHEYVYICLSVFTFFKMNFHLLEPIRLFQPVLSIAAVLSSRYLLFLGLTVLTKWTKHGLKLYS